MKMNKTRRNMIIGFLLFNFGALLFSFLYLYFDYRLGGALSDCHIRHSLRIYCPGCGATRAVKSLLRFDVLAALKYNFAVVYMVFAVAYYEIRMIKAIVKKDFGIFLKSSKFPLIILAILFIAGFFIKNILLVFFGIDLIGDFIRR